MLRVISQSIHRVSLKRSAIVDIANFQTNVAIMIRRMPEKHIYTVTQDVAGTHNEGTKVNNPRQ